MMDSTPFPIRAGSAMQGSVGRRLGRAVAGLLVTPLLAGSLAVLTPLPAGAIPTAVGTGYPYPNAPDCDEGATLNGCVVDAWNFYQGQCTSWVAWRLRAVNGVSFTNTYRQPAGYRWSNASNWPAAAARAGIAVDTRPARGAVAWYANHVAYVEAVNADGSIVISELNFDNHNGYRTRTARPGVSVGTVGYWPSKFIHIQDLAPAAPDLSQYRNSIVRWSGNAYANWFVTPDLKRLWIPDGGTFNELRARGFAGPHVLDSATLDRLPDQTNQWVASGSTWTGNRSLRRGMSVRSSDGRYLFAMQDDGNLVLYGPTGRALWATSFKTSAWGAQEYVIFQADGNLVTYGGGRAIWNSGTYGRGADRFVVQSDGNLVIYRGATPLWSSGTAGRT